MVVALAFLATDFLLLFLKQIDGRDFLKRLVAIAVPVLILGAFLIKQKIDLGWFFFPEHIGLIDTDRPYASNWINYQMKDYNYGNIDLLQYNRRNDKYLKII